MKECPYCGKEYPDDAVVCAIDRQALDPPAAQPEPAPKPAAPVRRTESDVVFPEYQWSQRDAWMFLAVIVLVNLRWQYLESLFFGYLPAWYRESGILNIAVSVIYAGICTGAAAYLARTYSVKSFCKAVGLDRRPTEYAWFGATLALGVSAFSAIIALTWPWAYDHNEFALLLESSAPGQFLFPLLFAVIWQEAVYRGFLYKAFRGSYSVPISIIFMVGITVYRYWNENRHFGLGVMGVSALSVVLCCVREKSESLWDCIVGHLVFIGFALLLAGFLGH